MKKFAVSLFMFTVLSISLSCLTGCDKTRHWEYRAYIVNGIDEGDFRSKTVFPDLEELNKLGEEGWELCGFEGSRNMFAATHIVAVFKRKRG